MIEKKQSPLVHIVIVNWNGYRDTIECIESLNKISYQNYKIVIVDNNSEFDYQKLLIHCDPGIVIIKSESNLGFAGGNNIGIRYSLDRNADFVLLLNNDTVVEADFLDKLVTLGLDREVGIVAPKILYYNNKDIVWSAGGKISSIGATGYTRGEGKLSSSYIKNKYVTFVSGCCMLIKKEVLIDLGLMDEDYFLYLEDTDLCKRVLNKGYKILFATLSIIYHKVNSSTKRNNLCLPIYYTTRNRLYFTKKFSPELLLLVKAFIYSTMYLKFIYWTIKGKKELITAVKMALSDFNNNITGKKEFINADWN